ncbi:MAG: asparaginase [Gammaproteobacteria bacterium]|nr:asparaginase [Gammaproteobacteria bacterium]
MHQRLAIFTTGGTIDKIYFDAKSEFQVGDPQIVELLKEANAHFEYQVEPLLRKDSLDLDEDDRSLIRDRIVAVGCTRVLVTHGTDTLVETALRLLDVDGKTIVLTGAMQPARLRVSDAIFNIGYAVAAAQILPPGVYIAINGQLFDPRRCRKNVAGNRFESC